ncbi:MAG: Hsp33 family molecular chaperone HslO, partial [Oscillospiraceae bacterium]
MMDRIIRCITHDGSMMIAAVDTTETVYIAQQLHNMSATAAAALGRTLSAASIMGSMLKGKNASITLKFNGRGPIGNIIAISDSRGNVRGYVDHPQLELPLQSSGKLDVGGAVGKEGRLGVIKDFGSGEPYIGQSTLVSGEIAEDITNYYAVSEQTPTVCALGVLADKETHVVILAGGLLIQALPGAYESDIAKLEKDMQDVEPMTTL